MPRTACQQHATRHLTGCDPAGANQIDRTGERVRVDYDLDVVVVLNASDRAVVECLRTDVTDAGAAREPGEPAVGDECRVLAPGQVAERGGDLGRLLHPRS